MTGYADATAGYLELLVPARRVACRGADGLMQARLLGTAGARHPRTAISWPALLGHISAPRRLASDWPRRMSARSTRQPACNARPYPTHRAARYARLCRLLSIGKGASGKSACDLGWQDLAAHGEGLVAHPSAGRPGRRACRKSRAAAGGFPRPGLSRADAAPATRRCGTATRAGRHGAGCMHSGR